VKYSNSSLQNIKIIVIEKCNENTKICKPRTKKIYKVLDDKVIQTKFKFFQSDILYPLFTSTQKEIDLNSLVPFIDGNQYDTFVDVLFATGNLFIFLNLPKKLINIIFQTPSYCFYKILKRGEGVKIEQYVNNPVNTFNKSSHENMKENIKLFLKKYEQNINDPNLELSIPTLFYCLTKRTPKQMLKYRRDEVISTFNTYNSDIQTFNLGNFHLNNLLTKTDLLHTDEFYDIVSQNNKPNTIIFIDLMQTKFYFYKRIGFVEKKYLNLFKPSKALDLIVLPNNFMNRELFQDYVYNINDYIDDKKDYNVERTVT
jgi:hypothetical protein